MWDVNHRHLDLQTRTIFGSTYRVSNGKVGGPGVVEYKQERATPGLPVIMASSRYRRGVSGGHQIFSAHIPPLAARDLAIPHFTIDVTVIDVMDTVMRRFPAPSSVYGLCSLHPCQRLYRCLS